jgi:error-prone DNA polymerase
MPESPQHKLREPVTPPDSVAASDLPYAELDVTTNFSFLRGGSHADELVGVAACLGYRALGVTDLNTLAGVVRAWSSCRKCGLKLVVGCRLRFSDGTPDLLAWCINRKGYANLSRMLTVGKRRTSKGACDLRLADLLDHADGLHIGIRDHSPVPDPGHRDELGLIRLLREAFPGRLSLCVSQLFLRDNTSHLQRRQHLAEAMDIPLLATNQVYYHNASRRPLQDVLVCIREKCTIATAGYRLFPNAERRLKSPAEMHTLFTSCPRAIDRTLQVADECTFDLSEICYEYPDELVPAGKTPIVHLTELVTKGVRDSGALCNGKLPPDVASELELIEKLRYEPYFLTVYDLVRFARSRGILCQGRGSAANSAVCYYLGVTSVDPRRIDLLFERFVSADRGEPPDIDIDFEHERREEVIQYLYQKYGRDRCGMAAEVITYRGRSAVRDVGKALGLTPDMVDSLAKKLDWWHRGTLTPDMIRACGLDPTDMTVRRVVTLTSELLGFPRHLGQHVGGMVMTRSPLCELVPIENAAMPDRTVIEWDKDDLEEVGMLKVDVLGLGMLSCISRAFRLLEATGHARAIAATRHDSTRTARGHTIQLHSIPPEDPAVYDMICDADTIGVFQIESRAQMSMLPRLRPRCFYDLVIEVAIVRPGPIQGNMVHPYLRRRCGMEPVTYPSEELRRVLHKTLGVPLFQEQAMRIAMVGAGFSGAEADQLRRAMAAWKRSDKLLHFQDRIIRGMIDRGYTPEFARQCFNQIKGFGEYGFPESHSASFALLVYVSAWLKRHHPATFAAALINSQPMGFYAPAQIARDAAEHGVQVLPVDVNHSDWDCTLEASTIPAPPPHIPRTKQHWGMGGPALRLGMRLIKGLSPTHAHTISACRSEGGRFLSVDDLHRRCGLPAHVVRRLAQADAFASMSLHRRPALWDALAVAEPSPLCPVRFTPSNAPLPVMPQGQEVMLDYETTGLSLKQHPLSLVRKALDRLGVRPASTVQKLPHGTWVRVAGLVLVRQRPGTASGIVFITLEDETGIVNLILRANVYERFKSAARHAGLIQCEGRVERQGQVVHVTASRLVDQSGLLEGLRVSSRDFH